MCSVDECDAPVPKQVNSSLGKSCLRCGEKAVVITRVRDAFCRGCFLAYVVRKFRATIGKSKLIREGERVLLAFSGDHSSSCLLHLVTEGLSENTYKKLRFKPGILYICEGSVTQQSQSERQRNLEQLMKICLKTTFPTYVSSLEQVYNIGSSDGEICREITGVEPHWFDRGKCPEEKLQALFARTKTLDAREQLIQNFRNRLLLEVAHCTGHTTVMVGSCGNQLATTLLSDIAQGRGAHAAINCGFSDTRHTDVRTVRPLKDFTAKEIAFYNYFSDVEPVVIPSLSTKTPSNASIQRLTETFVSGLQAEYPSTVSNITRTGEKLDLPDKNHEGDVCAMCQASLDTSGGPASALSSVWTSEELHQDLPTLDDSFSQVDHNRTQGCELMPFCYGCWRFMREVDDDEALLPQYIQQKVAQQQQHGFLRDRQRNFVKDFLLPPESHGVISLLTHK